MTVTFNLRGSIIIFLIFSIISGVVTSSERPERSSSEVLLRLFLNSETQSLTVEYDGEKTFSVEFGSSLIRSGVKLFKLKNLMTARFSDFRLIQSVLKCIVTGQSIAKFIYELVRCRTLKYHPKIRPADLVVEIHILVFDNEFISNFGHIHSKQNF